jgi:isocitrate dehydrogenase
VLSKPGSRARAGVDVFVESALTPLALGRTLEKLVAGLPLRLALVSNRGVKVYPLDGPADTDVVDCWCARFHPTGGVALNDDTISVLLSRISAVMPWMHVEKLAAFDGTASYSKSAGED